MIIRVNRSSEIGVGDSRTNRAQSAVIELKDGKRDEAMTTSESKQRRGFGLMPSEQQREISCKGGRAAHIKGTAHEWTTDEARSAGRKGAQASRGRRAMRGKVIAITSQGSFS
jgi:uncharacterized protein